MHKLSLLVFALLLGYCLPVVAQQKAKPGKTLYLFNGKNLEGWRGFKSLTPPAGWQVQDGAIYLAKAGTGDLVSVDTFAHFDLGFEWKISPKGNSGLFFHVREEAAARHTYDTGPEYQILDNAGHPDNKLKSHQSGAFYDLVATDSLAAAPVGEWNKARIIVTADSVKHYLNGKQVVAAPYQTPAFWALVSASKFKNFPLFARKRSGHIALQDHGNPVWFRAITVTRLP